MQEPDKDAIRASLVLANKEPLETCDTFETAQKWRTVYVRILSGKEQARTHAIIIHRPSEKGGWQLLLFKLTSDSITPLRICYSFEEAQRLLHSYAQVLTKEGRGATHAVIVRQLRGPRGAWGIFEFKRSGNEES